MLSGGFNNPYIIANVIKSQNSISLSKEEYIKTYLSEAIRKFRGRKRLRKKKAVKYLELKWRLLQIAKPISKRVGYDEIARKMFSVEPLPEVKLYYIKDYYIEDLSLE
jgi:hypothetical protein